MPKTWNELDLNRIESMGDMVKAAVEKKAKGTLWVCLYENTDVSLDHVKTLS